MQLSITITFDAPLTTETVICTGTFDDWKGETEMKLDETDHQRRLKLFCITLTLPIEQTELIFKFIVDGEWKTSPNYQKTGSGSFENNILVLQPNDPIHIPCSAEPLDETGTLDSNEIYPDEINKESQLQVNSTENTLSSHSNQLQSEPSSPNIELIHSFIYFDGETENKNRKFNSNEQSDNAFQDSSIPSSNSSKRGVMNQVVSFFVDCFKGRALKQKTK